MQTYFENYNFSQLLRGHIPLSPQAPKFCQSLILAPPLLKNSGSTPDLVHFVFQFLILKVKGVQPFLMHMGNIGPNLSQTWQLRKKNLKEQIKLS